MTAGDVEVAGLSALTERLYSSNPGCLCRKNAPNSKVSRNANPNIRNRVWLCSKIFDDRIAAGEHGVHRFALKRPKRLVSPVARNRVFESHALILCEKKGVGCLFQKLLSDDRKK